MPGYGVFGCSGGKAWVIVLALLTVLVLCSVLELWHVCWVLAVCWGFLGNASCEVMMRVELRRFWQVACFRGAGGLWGVEVMEGDGMCRVMGSVL